MNRLSRILLLPLAALLTAVGVQAQQVAWTGSAEHLQGNDYRILIEAAIPSGYHMYDMGPYEGGPNATTFLFTAEGAALEGSVEQLTTPDTHFATTRRRRPAPRRMPPRSSLPSPPRPRRTPRAAARSGPWSSRRSSGVWPPCSPPASSRWCR